LDTTHFAIYHREPIWRPKRQINHALLDQNLATWLFDSSSLTERLIAACSGSFSVQVLKQGWSQAMINEARVLKMRLTRRALVREVHLLCNGEPWVFARTVIPPHTLKGKQRRLAKLGRKPLGAVLFADKSMQRSEMDIACIQPDQQLYRLATHHLPQTSQPIWGRRSVFFLNNHPLIVSEIFLPQIGEPAHRCQK
jgi:chorismate--pyruvate lyase